MNHLDESIGFLVGQTYRKLTLLVTQRMKEYDITPEQWAVLHRIRQHDGLNQKEIAIRSAKDQPTTTRILDALSKKGLIEKQMSKADRRAFLVFVTEKGTALLEATNLIEQQAIHDAVAGIDPEHLKLMKECLGQIRQNIEQILTK